MRIYCSRKIVGCIRDVSQNAKDFMKLRIYSYLLSAFFVVPAFGKEMMDPMQGLPNVGGGVGQQKFDPSAAGMPVQMADHKSFEKIMSEVSPEERAMMEQMLAMFPPGEGEQLIEELFNMPPEQLNELVTQANQVLQEQNIDINQIEQALAEGNWPPPELMQQYEPEPYIQPAKPYVPQEPEKKSPERVVTSQEKAGAQTLKKRGQEIVRLLQSLQIKSLEEESIAKKLQPHQIHIADIIFYIEALTQQNVLDQLKPDEIEQFSKKLEKLYDVLNKYEPQIIITKKASTDFFDPYLMLGIPHSATQEEIETKYQELREEKDPEILRTTTTMSERELQKARARFKPIKQAYLKINDASSRAEYDRIIKARTLNSNRLEASAQRALMYVIDALEEAFFSTMVNAEAQKLATAYNATAVEARKKQLAADEAAAKKLEEYRKERQAPATPVPGSGGYGGYGGGDGYGYPGGGYGGGGYEPRTPNFPSTPQQSPAADSGSGSRQPLQGGGQAAPEKKDDAKKKKKKGALKKKARKKAQAHKKPFGLLKAYMKQIDTPELAKRCKDLYEYMASDDAKTVKDDAVLAQELQQLEKDLSLSKLKELLEQYLAVLDSRDATLKIQGQKRWHALLEQHKQIAQPLFALLAMSELEMSSLKKSLHYGDAVTAAVGAPQVPDASKKNEKSFRQFQERNNALLELLSKLALPNVNLIVKQLGELLNAVDTLELKKNCATLEEYMKTDYTQESGTLLDNKQFAQGLQMLAENLKLEALYEHYMAIKQAILMAPSAEMVYEAKQQFKALEKKHELLFAVLTKLANLKPEDMAKDKRYAYAGDANALTKAELDAMAEVLQEKAEVLSKAKKTTIAPVVITSEKSFIEFQEALEELEQLRNSMRFKVSMQQPVLQTKTQNAKPKKESKNSAAFTDTAKKS